MKRIRKLHGQKAMRVASFAVTAAILTPTLTSCGNPESTTAPPPAMAPPNARLPQPIGAPQARTGMTGKQKLMLLAGAAALYYMYKKHQNAQGQQVQYYQSKNGGIYYRDPKNPKQAIFVTPPRNGIQVPAEEAQAYSGYRGYNNQDTGQTFGSAENFQGQPSY